MIMEILTEIRNHPLFQEYYDRLKEAERGRRFCRHQMEHLLDVARIAYILNLEQKLGIRKEVIYAAALLHDIGKYRQYAEGIPHELASVKIAEKILEDLPYPAFTDEEKQEILKAIRGHRRMHDDMDELERLLYISDKKSRQCFACEAEPECSWSEEKKNLEIEI